MMLRRTNDLRCIRKECAAFALLVLVAGGAAVAAPVEGYKVVAKYPHSTSSYTEGFFYLNGFFYEGTGLQGQSQLLVSVPKTGQVMQRVDLPPQYFGEGIIDWGANIYEWTWQSNIGFVYDRS